ncbi:HypC/HybG/HupF family hydrogenase formation chaperone [Halioxenophilus sp. WMMB6]|uniref:HypC/HybG/HupF family hydrogenase formation chaperone n=1 Tax=Halioxenophilus sp. WMMB6 TaxID=3073815 RepID=UPI00295E3BE2|nr:HypC/HybG/HupF family hydrogenase formation chaperone [Halioxenophilus sp. WMMB6]
MCLAVPAQVLQIDSSGETALVALGEIKKSISLALVEQVNVGDFVLIHVGYALEKISAEAAEKTLRLFAELPAQLMEPLD